MKGWRDVEALELLCVEEGLCRCIEVVERCGGMWRCRGYNRGVPGAVDVWSMPCSCKRCCRSVDGAVKGTAQV